MFSFISLVACDATLYDTMSVGPFVAFFGCFTAPAH